MRPGAAGQMSSKKKKIKKKQIRSLRFFRKKQIQKKDKKRSKYVVESVSEAHFWGVAESASQRPLTGRNALSQTDGRTDSCVEIKQVSRGCQFQTKMPIPQQKHKK
jgi:hypothetical protein